MYRYPLEQGRLTRLVVTLLSSATLAVSLCGCQTTASPDITGSLGDQPEVSQSADPRRDVEIYRERYKASPKDSVIAPATGASGRIW